MDFIDREKAKRHAKEQVTQAGPAAPAGWLACYLLLSVCMSCLRYFKSRQWRPRKNCVCCGRRKCSSPGFTPQAKLSCARADVRRPPRLPAGVRAAAAEATVCMQLLHAAEAMICMQLLHTKSHLTGEHV